MLGCGAKLPNEMQLYRCEGNRLSDGDLQKILVDFGRLVPFIQFAITDLKI